jgi:phage baseplate assembly protein W
MAQGAKSFLGTGWGFPPTFVRPTNGVMMVSDEVDIHQSLQILFSTHPGERVMLPLYGSDLDRVVFEAIDRTLIADLSQRLTREITTWEPRILVDDISMVRHADLRGVLTISIDYTIRRTNNRGNFVFPFYLQEATIAPPT